MADLTAPLNTEPQTRKEWGVRWDFDGKTEEIRHLIRDETTARYVAKNHQLAKEGHTGTVVFRYVTNWIKLKTEEDTDE